MVDEKIEKCTLKLCDLSNKISSLLSNSKKTPKTRISKGYLETRLETLTEYWSSYTKEYNSMIEEFKISEMSTEGFDPEDNYFSTEESFMELKAWIKDYLYEISKTEILHAPSTSIQNKNDNCDPTKMRPMLPRITIPKFSGEYHDWMSFRDLFTTLIHEEKSLSKIEKHHYLKSSLCGEAEQLLKHFALTEANYDEAWKTLENRYDNKRIIVNHILNRFLSQKKTTYENARYIRELLDTTKECLNSLKNLGVDVSTWDAIVIHVVISKLDMESHRLWEQSLGTSTKIPTFEDLSTYLESRFRSLEMLSTSTNQTKDAQRKDTQRNVPLSSQQNKIKPATVKTFLAEIDSTCTYCSQSHYICHCKDFATLEIPDRQEFVKKNGICFNCLVKGHSVSHCRQSTTCRKCGRRHHTLLHNTNFDKTATTSAPENDKKPDNEPPKVSMKTEMYNQQVILATAQIAAKAKNGATITLRALIDPGSQASFVTEDVAQLLGLDRVSVDGKISGISNSSVITTKSMVTLKFHSTKDTTSQFEVNTYVLRKLTSLLPSQEFPLDTWPSSKNLDLADPDFHKPGSIDVLLGADIHAQLMLDGLQRHESLIALNSHLGWLISGRVTQTDLQTHNVVVTHLKLEVDQLLRQFWELEEYLPQKKPLTNLERRCEEHYTKTHTRNDEGRYVVGLPFKDDDVTNLGDSRPLAVKRLLQMERRYINKPDFKEEYCKFMREYEAQGHMEKVPETVLENNYNKKKYYLPHHAVIRESSLSTKLRVVFDGSATPENGNSLNEELMIGPPLQRDIKDLIIRWRQHKYALVSDIQKMYRQILISSNDCDYQIIVWRETPQQPIKEYRLLTVTYGTSCAPFLAIRTIKQLANDEYDDFPEESEILNHDVYMDDLMSGADTEEETITLQKRLTELLARGGFPLHKWASNSEKVLSEIPDHDKESKGEVNIKVKDTMKALGITWNSNTDNFELKINMNSNINDDSVTKRSILSAIAKTFDPLGWLAPVVIVLKIFMQKLWLAGLDWDDELPDSLKVEWCAYLQNIADMRYIELPRWIGTSSSTTKVELHGFSDASCTAYAGVVYLRVWNGNDINVYLITAKTKVAPVKQVSLPRLELCGAVLIAKMLNDVKISLKIDDENVYAWTDSTIVLAWLHKTPGTWTTFVANRTAEILTVMNSSQWHHVQSLHNPADVASRGLSPRDLKESQLWWEGPSLLREPVKMKINTNKNIPDTDLESKAKIVSHVGVDECLEVKTAYLSKFSNLRKLIRVTAYCLRFVKRCKSKIIYKQTNNPEKIDMLPSYLTASEMKKALNICIKMSQEISFDDEITKLTQGKPIPKTSKIYVLNAYLDNERVLRVGGRLVNADIPTDMKSPVLLMNNCHLAKLIVMDAHFKTLHGGNQLTLNYVKRSYWIVRVKSLIKTIIRKCITCYKHRAKPVAPFMGNLPECRVKPSRPFRTSGVDFAGPFTLKLYSGRCNRTSKAYVCLFVCTVTKAIHLEVVSDLSSAAFLAAFKRFTARRGHCKDIWSDCGTNFTGASRELNLAFKNFKSHVVTEIAELLANDQTTWHFIPPGTPHFGGLWESGVKSVKGHLRRVVGQTSLTFEEFCTLLTQVEACLNSRPLTLTGSSSDELPLTPGHFLIGEAPISVPEESLDNVKISPLNRWHIVQRLVQNLWRRWQIEYLTNLQHRYKWAKSQPDIPLGTVVLVKDDRLPPGKWLLGRVIAKHPGTDGITRVVTLQYKNNTFKRPITKLCPLPLDVTE